MHTSPYDWTTKSEISARHYVSGICKKKSAPILPKMFLTTILAAEGRTTKMSAVSNSLY